MDLNYILLTAAKNEEAYIPEALRSVVRQTALPTAWFIVDDGSTDRTAEIIRGYAEEHPFIRLLARQHNEPRNFGSKDKAIQAAYDLAKAVAADFIGIQDADIAPDRPDYYETVLRGFAANPRLGLACGCLYERVRGEWAKRQEDSDTTVPGGVQMFRRSCFDQIGGYKPLFYGGEDTLAQLEAERLGWESRVHRDQKVFHYRTTASASGIWRGCFRGGLADASFGYHPIYEIGKCLRRFRVRPLVGGAVVRFSGYLWWKLNRRQPLVPPETVAFLRKAQTAKVRRSLRLPF